MFEILMYVIFPVTTEETCMLMLQQPFRLILVESRGKFLLKRPRELKRQPIKMLDK